MNFDIGDRVRFVENGYFDGEWVSLRVGVPSRYNKQYWVSSNDTAVVIGVDETWGAKEDYRRTLDERYGPKRLMVVLNEPKGRGSEECARCGSTLGKGMVRIHSITGYYLYALDEKHTVYQCLKCSSMPMTGKGVVAGIPFDWVEKLETSETVDRCKKCNGPLITAESKARGICEGCSGRSVSRSTFVGEPSRFSHGAYVGKRAPEGSVVPGIVAGLAIMLAPLAYFLLKK